MARLFLSHSSRDNVQAIAFQNWLTANGWTREDVFIDLHSIGAGARWRESLRKASARCEAVILLASPESMASIECQKELELAEALGKEIIIAIVRDLTKDDSRLARYSERQFVDLTAEPKDQIDPFEFEQQVHRIAYSSQALAAIKARLDDLGIAPDSFAWPPKGATSPEPYPGLSAFGEDDAGIFFGREADILSALTEIRQARRRRAPRVIVIDAASGAGKSSFLRAGLWPRLKRDPNFAPLGILRPAQGIFTGPDGLGRRLAPFFERYGKPKAAGAIYSAVAADDIAAGVRAFNSILSDATELAWQARRTAMPEATAPSVVLAIDQGEELFSAENEGESRKFLELLAAVFKQLPSDVDPYLLVTIRADSVQSLLNRVAELRLETPKAIYLTPLSPAAYRDVILKPAEVFSENVRHLAIEPSLEHALVKDATGGDALPLLSFTLSRLFGDYGATGQLTLAQYHEMGGTNGSISRALKDALARAGGDGSLENLRRLFIPRLATWDPDADQGKGAVKRMVAKVDGLVGGDRAHLAGLANALISARLLTRSRDTIEVAHEALLRQTPIKEWLEESREFLAWRDRLARERASYERNQRGLLAARELQIARDWLSAREKDDIAPEDCKFILDSIAADDERRAREEEYERQRRRVHRRMLQMGLLAAVLFIGIGAGIGWANRDYLIRRGIMLVETIRPKVLTAEAERTLKPQDRFKECADCPEMVVVPAGLFMMGSPDDEKERFADESPRHRVSIAKPFAVGRVAVTFEEWDACVTLGGCASLPADQGWGRGSRPVINVSWEEAQQYVRWLSVRTGKQYRLLSESEFEYAARANKTTRYSWGDDIGNNRANCLSCGSQWDLKQTAPVGSFAPNDFGLYDMHGNTWSWVQDCYRPDYQTAPTDGSPRAEGADCNSHIVRGGAWYSEPAILRSANRGKSYLRRLDATGLRVARTLLP